MISIINYDYFNTNIVQRLLVIRVPASIFAYNILEGKVTINLPYVWSNLNLKLSDANSSSSFIIIIKMLDV